MCSRSIDLGIDYGSQKRTREFLNWLKKKKKYVKRDELISFLSGEPYHSNEGGNPQPSPPVSGQMEESMPFSMARYTSCSHLDPDYNTQSHLPFSVSQRLMSPPQPDSPSPSMHATPSPRRKTTLKLGDPHQFFREICIDQTRKRIHNSPQDMITDYPSAKREKLFSSPQQ